MTENMAARGEGLAGPGERKRLVRRLILAIAKEAVELAIVRSELTWDEAADITEEQIAKDAALAIFGAGTCDDQPTENVQKLLAALEAAAPAGTAPPELLCVNCGHSYAQHTKGINHPQKYCRHCPCLEWAALATPSSQAPAGDRTFSPTSAREQSSATASNEPSVGDEMHFIGRVDWLLTNGDIMLRRGKATYRFKREDIVPAATQEQPAGSEASESSVIAFEKTWQQLKHQMEYEEKTLQRVPNDWPLEKRTAYWMYLSVIEDGWEAGKIACMSADPTATHHKWPTVRNRAEAEALRSPRKVGEDGPVYRKVLYKGPPEHATPLWLINCDEGWRVSIVCEGMYEWAADWILEQIQGKPFAPRDRPGARSSSVPVGEQKQEEGV